MTSGGGSAGGGAGSGTGSGIDGDARRWAQAEERSAGVVVPDEWPVLRRFLLVELPVVLVVCVGGALVVSLIWGEWREWLGNAVSLTGIFCMGRSLARAMARDPEPTSGSMVMVLTPEQRRRNGRQVMGQEPVDADHLNVLRLAARHLRRVGLRTVYSFTGLELLCTGNAITSLRNGWFFVFFLAGIVVGVVLLILSLRQIRRTTAFLRRHPEPSPSSLASS